MKSATFTSMESVVTNKRIDTDLIEEKTNIRKLSCMLDCLNDVTCDSIGYHSDDMKCRLYNVVVSGSGGVTEIGWGYYSIREDFCSEENFHHNRVLDLCYYSPAGKESCPEAIDICANFSANLLIVDNQAKQDWMTEFCVTNNVDGTFFDAYMDSSAGVWRLGSTGMALTYTYWDGGQPNMAGLCIGTISIHGWYWHDYPVHWKAGIICEIRRP
ncbi:C-type lectin domain family 4 member A-like [Ylistrum balloti]|uniref:C-type lectin domain family 4 member A-like n=1 Tax=Ylistrum balloti TaxID=509963 RepID=UPI0029058E72|nr:C-type lectin domain family 4 member A-like [Ylistrum balloti]